MSKCVAVQCLYSLQIKIAYNLYALAVCGFKTSIHTNMSQKAIAKIERSKGNPQN